MDNMPSNYRHQPYETSKRRKMKRNKTKNVFHTPDKDRYGTGSWFDQKEIKSKLAESAVTSFSTSEKKLYNWKNSFNLGSSKENSDSENELYIENDKVPGVKQWIIHLDNRSKYLKSFCICKYCSGELEMEEIVHVLI